MKSKKVNWGHVIVFIILILCMIVTLLPFVWMILTSLKTQAESICIPLKIFPEKPLFSNYAAVFTKIPFAKMYLNTAVTATVIVVVQHMHLEESNFQEEILFLEHCLLY